MSDNTEGDPFDSYPVGYEVRIGIRTAHTRTEEHRTWFGRTRSVTTSEDVYRSFRRRVPPYFIAPKTTQIRIPGVGDQAIVERTSLLNGWTSLWLGYLSTWKGLHHCGYTPEEGEALAAKLVAAGFTEQK